MSRTSGRILKSEDVELEGQFLLDIAQIKCAAGEPKKQISAPVTPQVRIIETHPEYAVMEVTCSCGTKMIVRCEYAAVMSPA